MIRTTINIGVEVHQRLKKAAARRKVSLEEVILILLRYMARKKRHELITKKAVCYQDRGSAVWECVHVKWEGEEYEFVIDLRKVHKRSVSRLIAEVVMSYINEEGLIDDHIWDNYQDHSYDISKINHYNKIGCIFSWEIPIKTTKTSH